MVKVNWERNNNLNGEKRVKLLEIEVISIFKTVKSLKE